MSKGDKGGREMIPKLIQMIFKSPKSDIRDRPSLLLEGMQVYRMSLPDSRGRVHWTPIKILSINTSMHDNDTVTYTHIRGNLSGKRVTIPLHILEIENWLYVEEQLSEHNYE